MRIILLLFSMAISLATFAQSPLTLPDSIDLVEAGDEIQIFDSALIFGKSYTVLYFSGPSLSEMTIQTSDGNDIPLNTERARKEIDYIKHRTWEIKFREKEYQAEVELIQVDWPGNEINWRMIPRIHFTEVR